MRFYYLFFLWPLVFSVSVKYDISAITCYKQYILTDSSEVPEITNDNTTTLEENALKGLRGNYMGQPACVIMRGYNGTHHVLIQDAWYMAYLPLRCHSAGEEAFHLGPRSRPDHTVPFTVTGYCEGNSLSNGDDHVLYMFDPYTDGRTFGRVVLNLLRTLARFALHITFYFVIVCIIAVGHFMFEKHQNKKKVQLSDHVKEPLLPESDEMESNSPPKVLDELEETQKTKISDKVAPAPGPVRPSTMSKGTKTHRGSRPSSAKTARVEGALKQSLKVVAQSPIARTPLFEPLVTPLMNVFDGESPTQGSVSPHRQSRPKPRVLPNGRIQRVSMNYSNSTYSDLE